MWMLQAQLTVTWSASTVLEERWYVACAVLPDVMLPDHGLVLKLLQPVGEWKRVL